MRACGSKRSVSGFTLLEVLVAVAVFAVFSALAYAGVTRVLEGRDRVEAEREKWRSLTLAFAQMEDDLAQARMRAVRGPLGTNLPAFSGQPVDPRPLGEPSLEFTRAGMFVPNEGSASDLRRVAYRLKDGALVRQVWPSLDRPPTGEPRDVHLLTNVDNLGVRFFSNNAWSDVWPSVGAASPSATPLPEAVEFAIDVAGIGRITRIFLVAQ